MSKMTRDLDVIVFGATGFTGKHCLPLIEKFSKKLQLKWGVAGRSEQKLKEFLGQCEKQTGTSLEKVPIIVANVQDEETLREMARKARIIINCCGPYRFFGEPVVKACVEEGTHHVDVSGEPQYMETMQLKYHSKAQEKGIYIISACGFDSIPSDLGVIFLQKKFNGTLNSVTTFMEAWEEDGATAGSAVNYGTWESAVYGLGFANELRTLRTQLFPTRLPSFKPKLPLKTVPHKNDLVEGWVLPFLGSDKSVIRRTQRLFYEKDSKRPVQVETYFILKSFMSVIGMMILGLIFSILAKFEFGRNLLLKYPEKFSFGFFSRDPPSEERIAKARFSVTLYGEGWKETLPDANDEYTTPPNKAIAAKVKGKNPGYGATCVCLVLAALTVITETDKMPPGGGVYPPGYAFAKTSLIEQLDQNEVNFEVLFEKDLPASKY
ncbi:saccharopine dehydrogenase-like oxidoreductase [Tribolium madens]|uniref:saccharopine dehydrogenase-like oxidoreductase n=1 Tax=Tribolium madens TaxID=41895 RepID=UPI001CF74093|nr:saccharopine dehydrogenase-like oxidoreductase [Tribolium madens]